MLITRVVSKLELGGAQLSLLRVAHALAARGHKTRLFAGTATPTGIELARRFGVETEVMGSAADLQWHCDPRFAAWLAPRLAGADVVHAHMLGSWWAAASAAPADVPLFASEHNSYAYWGEPPWTAMAEVAGRVDRFYAHGPGARAGAIQAGVPKDRIRSGLSPVAGMKSRRRAGLPVPRIVFSGRFSPDKGPDVLVEAVARMSAPPPVLMLGAGVLEDELRGQVVEAGLEGVVRFPGWVEEPGPWIAGSAVQACPSRDESFSQTAVLAMALGVPVVGTDVDGFPETLGAGRGVIVPPEDPEALAVALDGDPRRSDEARHDRRPKLGAAVRARAGGERLRAGLWGIAPGRRFRARRMSGVPGSKGEADLHAWHVLGPLLARGPYLPWTSGSMRPAALVAVCNEIVHGGRTRIVECGSGSAACVVARLLRERESGTLVALEHDLHWAALVEEQLRREDLGAIARVLYAPLRGASPWYDLHDSDRMPAEVDLLVVDGPPAFDPGHGARRAPALPWFEGRLVPGATVLLDDIDREGEREILSLWEKSSEWRFTSDELSGLATGRRLTDPRG